MFTMALLSIAQRAHAWSSRASRTDNEIHNLSMAIEVHQIETGEFPRAERYWIDLGLTGAYDTSDAVPPSDSWGRPLVYRVPGKHAEFDLYSCGNDGIDDDGKDDDISNWAGVNDGFYWKTTWPKGRVTIGCGVVLGLGCLLFTRVYPRRVIIPLAGLPICVGVILGCHWLMHPGIVPSRNNPLALSIILSSIILAALLMCLVVSLRRRIVDAGVKVPDFAGESVPRLVHSSFWDRKLLPSMVTVSQ